MEADEDEDKWDRERAFNIADSLENVSGLDFLRVSFTEGLAREIVTESEPLSFSILST